ncbi:hypothetical protein ASF57_23030 [Methylobacterium sp. Leaf117]|nr:hypothetical protein ASF57_23030 [Methylobacterium sp. Leaf117]
MDEDAGRFDAPAGQTSPRPDGAVQTSRRPTPALLWHGDADPYADRAWLVRDLVFETGTGLLSGQWGSGKTFGALDLSASVMTGIPFAGRKVSRRGGVLFIAPEGAFEINPRLRGLIERKLGIDEGERLPFGWVEECPRLLDETAADELADLAKRASTHMQAAFGLPLALIIIDTIAAGAGFEDENSSAEGQKLMNAMAALSRRTGAFVMGVDHFGKTVESGTRGTSAKEAGADVVLAMLGTRDDAGHVSNTRMAVRKLRGGRSGFTIPYILDEVRIGETSEGDPITTCVVEWQETVEAPAPKAAAPKWTNVTFRDAVRNALAEHGTRVCPFGMEGPGVVAVPLAKIREEFMASYPAEAAEAETRSGTKRKAYNRARDAAVSKKLIVSRDIGGEDYVWLAH